MIDPMPLQESIILSNNSENNDVAALNREAVSIDEPIEESKEVVAEAEECKAVEASEEEIKDAEQVEEAEEA